MIERQSMEGDAARRKQILWAIERKLAEDNARPIIFYNRNGTCWQPSVSGLNRCAARAVPALWSRPGCRPFATRG